MRERLRERKVSRGYLVLAAIPVIAVCGLLAAGALFIISLPKGDKITDPAQPVEVRVGAPFSIVLETKPDTGYKWQIDQPPDGNLIRLAGSEDKPVGIRGGEEVWTFQALAPGHTTLRFKNVGPVPDHPNVVQGGTFTIVVR